MTTFKMVVSTIADRYGLVADFSPMPLAGMPGNGYHINIYATNKDGEDVVKHAAAGILEKIRDITIFLNPTDASYARFGNSTAPDKVIWTDVNGDTSELMYIEEYKGRTRAELRSPDASGNPYLVYALLIYAGLSGIERKAELPKDDEKNILHLPGSRSEAERYAASSDFVKELIPEVILKEYVRS